MGLIAATVGRRIGIDVERVYGAESNGQTPLNPLCQ